MEITTQAFSIEQLRERLRPFDAVEILNEVQETLREEWRHLSKNQIDALRLQSDNQFRKLKFSVPELKAVDHSFNESNNKVNFVINMVEPTKTEKEIA